MDSTHRPVAHPGASGVPGDAGYGGSLGLHHEALLYTGEAGFLAGTVPFVREGLEADQAVLVVVPRHHIDVLHDGLGADARAVRFADMGEVGANPARIIPAWRDFVDEQRAAGREVRGVGEPVHPGRTQLELDECVRHEALLNLAFAGLPAWPLLCPYDTSVLDPLLVHEAHRTHPVVRVDGWREPSADFHGQATPFAGVFADPPPEAVHCAFASGPLDEVRAFVEGLARSAGLRTGPCEDLLLAVHEMVTNSLRHGGGRGVVSTWREPGAFVCEVRDAGGLNDPLAGRRRPPVDELGGRGMWLANQLCDLVQIRSSAGGTAVRLWMRLDARGAASS